MANEEAASAVQKKVKIKVTRVRNPTDLSDIFVGENGIAYLIQPGKTAEVPIGVYNILKNSTSPFTSLEEDETGNMRSRTVDSPEYAIIVDGVEGSSDTNARVAAIAKESAAKVDALKSENETLQKKIDSLESDSAATAVIAAENEDLKKRIAELEASAK